MCWFLLLPGWLFSVLCPVSTAGRSHRQLSGSIRCLLYLSREAAPLIVTMDTDAPHAQENEYGSSPWVDMGAFEPPPLHSPPMPDFNNPFSYGPAPVMPMEPAYSMSIPPPYTALHLSMPSHPWPSMLTTQSNFSDSTLSAAPAPTLSIPQPAPMRPIRTAPALTGPTPRRTLTDEDRRRMCLYHEENKHAKQTDIGGKISTFWRLPGHTKMLTATFAALFGVERR